MSKYHDIKNKIIITAEEEKEYKKSAITKIIEAYYNKGEEIPEIVLDNIDFTKGVFSEYMTTTYNHHLCMKTEETIGQNIINNLPFEMYEKYIDITWLKTYNKDVNQLMYSLIYHERFEVINRFLDIISKEIGKDDFNREVFEPIFHLEQNIYNLEKNTKAIKQYYEIFKKALTIWENHYNETCETYNVIPKDVKKWHKEYENIYQINNKNKLHTIQLYLLKSDDYLDIIKDIFGQYDNANENLYLAKEYMEEAVKNGSEKIVTYYISELLKENQHTIKEIEKSIKKAHNENMLALYSYISSSFNDQYKNDYANTYNIKESYNIVTKYGNYEPNYEILSYLLLVDNKEFQENFVKKVLPKEEVKIKNLNINQWKTIDMIIENIKQITGSDFKKSSKQNKHHEEKNKKFIDNNAFEFIYIINQINKIYPGKPEKLSEKQLNEVYEYIKSEVQPNLINNTINIDKLKLNHKLQDGLNEVVHKKEKNKHSKI